jgi:microcystin-dependent protein
MSDQFVAEIRMFGCNFAPNGWALCNGQILSISQNTALFSLLGTQYGGNGSTNFALPNLQSAGSLNAGNGPGLTPRDTGETGGVSAIALIIQEMPSHNHGVNAKIPSNIQTPVANIFGNYGASRPAQNYYAVGNPNTGMNPGALSVAGGSQPHNNLMPYQTINFCIALQGVYPPRQ